MQHRSCAHCAAFSPHPLPSHPPVHLHLSLASTMCSRASCNPAAQSPIHAPLAVETNATPILAQSPIHRLTFARPVADKMQLTFPNSLSLSTLLLVQLGQPHTRSPQFKANVPLEQSRKPSAGQPMTAPHLPDHRIKTTNVMGTGYGFGLP